MSKKNVFMTVAAVALMSAGAVHGADYTMKIAHVVPQGDPRDLGAREVVSLLDKDDRCSIEATVYPSAQLGGTVDLIEGMQIGSIEAVLLPAAFMVGFEPKIGIMDFPYFLPADLDDLIKIHDGPAMRKLLDTTTDEDIVSLKVWHTGYKQWTGNKPLANPSDYDGLKARVMPSPVLVEQQKALGLTPVNMAFPETYNALQSGAIDAQENPMVTSYVMKFHEVQSDVTMTDHGTLDQLFMVSKIWWDQLTPDCRAAVRDAVDEARDLVVEKTVELTKTAMEAFEAEGVKVTEITEEQRQALRDATLPAVEAFYVQETGEEGKAILEAFKAELAELE